MLMAEKSRRTTIYLTPDNYRRLRLRAAESGCSLSDLVNDLLSKGGEVVPVGSTYPPVLVGNGRVEEVAPDYWALAERLQIVEQKLGVGREAGTGMTLEGVRALLDGHRDELKEAGAATLSAYGSVVRGEAGPDSDVDLLVEFSEPVGLFKFFRLKEMLEKILGRPVDLCTPDSLHPALKSGILAEATCVF
jgi:predicted nucleotidyltransferase